MAIAVRTSGQCVLSREDKIGLPLLVARETAKGCIATNAGAGCVRTRRGRNGGQVGGRVWWKGERAGAVLNLCGLFRIGGCLPQL